MSLDLRKIKVFLGEQSKQLQKRGHNFIASNKVRSVSYDHELKHVRGKVEASKRKQVYEVWVDMSRGNPSNWPSCCGCARNQAKCAHRAALLLQAYRKVSSTSMPCMWSQRKAAEDDAICTVSNVHKKPVFRPDYPPIDKSVYDRLREDLKKCPEGSGAGVLFLLKDEPPEANDQEETPKVRLPVALEILNLEEVKSSDDPEATIRGLLHVPWTDIVSVAKLTAGQSSNPKWARLRRGRLTASRFGDILKIMSKNKPPTTKFLEDLAIHKNLNGVKSILWGRTHEKVALKAYTQKTGQSVEETGLWVHESGILGASPDGFVGNDTVIEIKCPYTHRKKTIEEALSKKDVVFLQEGEWMLNTEHNYYHQVQGQLYLTKRQNAVLIIWTMKNFNSLNIPNDLEWAKNIDV